MCLSYATKLPRLKENINCFKVLSVYEDGELRSPVVKSHDWQLGTTYAIGKKDIHCHYGMKIYEDAFHSYSSVMECFRSGIVNEKTYKDESPRPFRKRIFRAVIPNDTNYVYKGSNYYTFGKVGLGFASEKLRIIEEVPMEEIEEALARDKELNKAITEALTGDRKSLGKIGVFV